MKEDWISTRLPALRPHPSRAQLGHAAEATPPTGPRCGGTAVTRYTLGFPWGQIQPWIRDPDMSIRDETPDSPRGHLSPSLCSRLRIPLVQWGSRKGHHKEHAVALV